MKKYLIIIFVLIACLGCAQINIPEKLSYDFDYIDLAEEPVDTSDVSFYIYQSVDSVNFELLVISPGLEYDFLRNNRELYNNVVRYFYVVAYWISEDSFAERSNITTGDLFRKIPLKSVTGVNVNYYTVGVQ